MVHEERDRYRSENKIGNDVQMILFAPGNTSAEVTWSASLMKKSLDHFFSRPEIKHINKENFLLNVICPEEDKEISD